MKTTVFQIVISDVQWSHVYVLRVINFNRIVDLYVYIKSILVYWITESRKTGRVILKSNDKSVVPDIRITFPSLVNALKQI